MAPTPEVAPQGAAQIAITLRSVGAKTIIRMHVRRGARHIKESQALLRKGESPKQIQTSVEIVEPRGIDSKGHVRGECLFP